MQIYKISDVKHFFLVVMRAGSSVSLMSKMRQHVTCLLLRVWWRKRLYAS